MSERDDLENLLKSPGWLRFTREMEDYWRDQLSNAVAIAANDRDDQIALQKIRQIIAAQKAVGHALAWPKEQLARVGRAEQRYTSSVNLSRGGI